jgi:hypothetical protein
MRQRTLVGAAAVGVPGREGPVMRRSLSSVPGKPASGEAIASRRVAAKGLAI